MLNGTLAFNKKFRLKFFGYVYSSAVRSILNLSKNFTGFFVELIWGGTELSTELLDLKKNFSKFFGYVQSTVVSWILSLSKNVTRVLPRTDPGGTRTLNRTLAFNRKFPLKFFGYV